MQPTYQTGCYLMRALSAPDRDLIHPHCRRLWLEAGAIVIPADTTIRHVYFLESGLSSTVAVPNGAEIALTGFEGCVGVAAILGVDRCPSQSVMHVGGEALEIDVPHLREAMNASPSLRLVLLRYVQAFLTQASQAAVANAHFTLMQRLSRWLLMAHDRLRMGDVPLTHDMLAKALGVRRASVTDALHKLEGEHVIRARRGAIRIVDRPRLKAIAAAAYGIAEAEYGRLLGP